jgi:hypothetical protein
MADAVTRRRAWLTRLRCPGCGKRVADLVTGRDGQSVEIRHHVPHSEYPAGSPSPTYTWYCPCGRPPHTRRHARLVAAFLGAARGQVDVLTLDTDI